MPPAVTTNTFCSELNKYRKDRKANRRVSSGQSYDTTYAALYGFPVQMPWSSGGSVEGPSVSAQQFDALEKKVNEHQRQANRLEHSGNQVSTLLQGYQRNLVALERRTKYLQEWIVEEFLDKIYVLCERSELEEAADLVFARIDSILSDGELEICDVLLSKVDVSRLDSNLMISFLMTTAAAAEQLPNRPGFFNRVETALRDIKGEQATASLVGRFK